MVATVEEIAGNEEMIKHLSHLANCQYKWLERIIPLPEAESVNWWEPVYSHESLKYHLEKSSALWIDFLNGNDEETLGQIIRYDLGADHVAEVTVQDIGLQLVFHSFHHRAQVQRMIRDKGLKPRFIEYIGSRIKKKGKAD